MPTMVETTLQGDLDIEPAFGVMVFDLFVEQAQELPVSDKFFPGKGRESTSETRVTMITEKVFEKIERQGGLRG